MRALHDEHAGALWAFVVRLTGDRMQAQDIVQETLLRAWKHPEVLDPERGSPRGWLFTVARRLVVDDWRTKRSRVETLPGELPERGQDDTDQMLQSWVVADALRQLSDDHRAVLVECYYRGRSVADALARARHPGRHGQVPCALRVAATSGGTAGDGGEPVSDKLRDLGRDRTCSARCHRPNATSSPAT